MIVRIDFIFCFILASSILTNNALRHSNLKNRKIINIISENLIKYFDLENKLLADEYFGNDSPRSSTGDENEKCENTEQINEYFLEVYSEKSNKRNITEDDLENLIKHQISKRYKNNEAKLKSEKYKCTRKKVR